MKSFFKILIAVAVVITVGVLAYSQKPKVYTAIQTHTFNPNKAPKSTEATFLAVGDIMLSRDVAAQMDKNNKNGNFPFLKIRDLLTSTDFNFGNLESPFSGKDTQDPDPYTFTFNAPMYSVIGLRQNNFRILNLANNHALNQGKEGLLFSKEFLGRVDIQTIGSGSNADEAWQSEIVERNGIKIGFIGATYGPTSDNLAQMSDTKRLQEALTKLRANADFIVVTMHAGTEYVRQPNWQQTKFARAAIDAGADMVIGAHPHWVQPIEQYKDKYIFYSLGNFIFDQTWSQETKEGLTLKISLTKTDLQTMLKQVELIPIIIDSIQPRVASETEKQSILKKIKASKTILK